MRSKAIWKDRRRDTVDVGPMWLPVVHLPLSLLFKAEYFKAVAQTEQSAEQVSLHIKYMISLKNQNTTTHIPWWDYERQNKSTLQLSRISSRITQSRFTTWDNGAMKLVYLHIKK